MLNKYWFRPIVLSDFTDVEFTDIDDARAEIERTLRVVYRYRDAVVLCSTEKELDIIRKVLNDNNEFRPVENRRYACLDCENLGIAEHLRMPCYLHKYIVA